MRDASSRYVQLKIIPFSCLVPLLEPARSAGFINFINFFPLSLRSCSCKNEVLPEVSNLILSFHCTHESTHDHLIQANFLWLAITCLLPQTQSLKSHPSRAVQSWLYEEVYGLQPPRDSWALPLLTTFDLHLTSRKPKSPVTILIFLSNNMEISNPTWTWFWRF